MISFKASDLHRQAQERLQQASSSKRLVLIHTLVALGSTLLIAGLNYLFSLQIAETGGLSGMGTRTLLSTAQTMLETAVMMALPFWQMGFIFIALNWARNIHAGTDDLLQGFRRLGPVLVFRILYGLVFIILSFAVVYLASAIFLMTPFSAPFLAEFSPLMDPSATAEQIEALFAPERMAGMVDTMTPLLIIFGIVFLIAAIPVFYRLRLGEFAVMDGFRGGGALLHSFRATKRNWRCLLKLDLHFWWFYALILLCNIIGNGNWLLPYLGIQLPLSETVSYFLFFGVGTALQILVLWQFRGQVLTSYAMLYDTLTQPQTAPVLEQAQ